MRSTTRTGALMLASALLAGACSGGDTTLPAAAEDSDGPAVSQLVDPEDTDVDGDQGEGGPAGGGQPIPVEGDGGIGGDPGDGSVQDLMILDGERVDVTGVCLVDDTPTYEVTLATGATVTITDPGGAPTLTYTEGDTTFRSTGSDEVNTQMQPGALSAQGPTSSDAGESRYVDTTLDISDLDAC